MVGIPRPEPPSPDSRPSLSLAPRFSRMSRRPVLNLSKRQSIIAMVANGSSRRVAARFIGCASSTITRTATRDPEFAVELVRAEQTAEVHQLRNVQSAAKIPKHWRAAAWLLERRNPEDFAPRGPNIVTERQFSEFITWIIDAISEDLPAKNFRSAIKKIDEIQRECKSNYAPIVIEPAGELEHANEEIAAKTTTETKQSAQSDENTNSIATHHPKEDCDLGADKNSVTGSDSTTSDDGQLT